MTARGAPSAGASAHARYRVLRAQHRSERVLVRLLVTAAVGVMGTGVFGWRGGLAAAGLVFAGHVMLARTRPSAENRWRRGAAAERRTGRFLSALDPAAYHVLHDRAVPGMPKTNLDHLVVGLTGVYAIASRRWTFGARVWADHRRLWVGGRPIGKLVRAAQRMALAVSERLTVELGEDTDVEAVIAVHGARLGRSGVIFNDAVLYRARRLPRYMYGNPVIFTSAQVTAIAAAAERAFPPMRGGRIGQPGQSPPTELSPTDLAKPA